MIESLSNQMPQCLNHHPGNKLAALCLAVVALAFGSLGCGGDSSSSAEAPTKAAFVKQGDKICRKADDRERHGLKSYSEKHESEFGSKNYESSLITAVGVPALEKEAEELSELTPPQGDEEKVDAIVAAIEQANEETLQEPARASEGSEDSPYAKPEKLARAYGFKVCGEL